MVGVGSGCGGVCNCCIGSCLAHHHHHNHHHHSPPPITTIAQCTPNYSTPTYITTATIRAVVRVANEIVVGVIYLSICLAVGKVVVVVLVDMKGRGVIVVGYFFIMWHSGGGEFGENFFKGGSCY